MNQLGPYIFSKDFFKKNPKMSVSITRALDELWSSPTLRTQESVQITHVWKSVYWEVGLPCGLRQLPHVPNLHVKHAPSAGPSRGALRGFLWVKKHSQPVKSPFSALIQHVISNRIVHAVRFAHRLAFGESNSELRSEQQCLRWD